MRTYTVILEGVVDTVRNRSDDGDRHAAQPSLAFLGVKVQAVSF